MSEYCMNLIVPPTLEEQVLDLLLIAPETSAFTSMPVFGHGASPAGLSTADQVLGRTRQNQVQIILAQNEADALIAKLRQRFSGTGIFFWLTAVTNKGEI